MALDGPARSRVANRPTRWAVSLIGLNRSGLVNVTLTIHASPHACAYNNAICARHLTTNPAARRPVRDSRSPEEKTGSVT